MDRLVAVTAGAHAVPLAVLDPPGRAEVGRLGDVEPVVEPGVVGVGEDHDQVPLLLHHLANCDAPRGQQFWGHHAHL